MTRKPRKSLDVERLDREKLKDALVALRRALATYPDPRAELIAAIGALEALLYGLPLND